MAFPLLQLPNEVILKVLRHSISELPKLLEIPEISDLIHDSVVILRYSSQTSDLELNPLIKQPIRWLCFSDLDAISQIPKSSFVYFFASYVDYCPWEEWCVFSRSVPVYFRFVPEEDYEELIFDKESSDILCSTLYFHIDIENEMAVVIFEDCDLSPILSRMCSGAFPFIVKQCSFSLSEISLPANHEFNQWEDWCTRIVDCSNDLVSFFVSQSPRMVDFDLRVTSQFQETSLSNLQSDSLRHLTVQGYSKLESSTFPNLETLHFVPTTDDTDFPSLMNVDAPKLERLSLAIDEMFPHISNFRVGNRRIELDLEGSHDLSQQEELDQSTFEFLDQQVERFPLKQDFRPSWSIVRMVNNLFPERLRLSYVNEDLI